MGDHYKDSQTVIHDDLQPYRCPNHRRTKWPGLGRLDTQILQQQCELCSWCYDEWYFDVPVGPIEPSIATAPWILRYPFWARNYANKIDMIYVNLGVWHVTELKPCASYAAIGQALLYTHLFDLEFPDLAPARPVIMTDWCYHHVSDLCLQNGIEVRQLPEHVVLPRSPMARPQEAGDLDPRIATNEPSRPDDPPGNYYADPGPGRDR